MRRPTKVRIFMSKRMSLVSIAPPGPYLAPHIIRERHMKLNAGLQSWRLFQHFRRVLLLALAGCAQPALTSAVAIPSISSGQARIWIYRDYQPSEPQSGCGYDQWCQCRRCATRRRGFLSRCSTRSLSYRRRKLWHRYRPVLRHRPSRRGGSLRPDPIAERLGDRWRRRCGRFQARQVLCPPSPGATCSRPDRVQPILWR